MAKAATVENIQGYDSSITTNVIWVDPNDIKIDPNWNYRTLQEEKVEEYAKSMASLGFLPSKPIVCIREGDTLLEREGHHRLAAACRVRADVPTFRVAVVLEDSNEAIGRQLIKSLVGNNFAQDSAIARGRLYSEVQALRMSLEKIASYTGRDVKVIKAEIALFEASGEVLQKAISDKRISLAVAKAIVGNTGGDEYAQNERVELHLEGQKEEEEAKEALQELQKEVQETLETPTPPTQLALLSDQLDDALTDEQKDRLIAIRQDLATAVDKQEQAVAPEPPPTTKSPLLVLENALSDILTQVVALDGSEEEEDYLPDGDKFSDLSLEWQDKIIVAYRAVVQEKNRIINKAKTAVRGGKKTKPEVNVQPTKGGTPPPDGIQHGTGEDGQFQKKYGPRVSLFTKMLMKGSHGQGFRDVKEAKEALIEAIQTDNDYYVLYLKGVLDGMEAPGFSFLTLKH